ncbi:hypothetical protein [Novosphingobium sp.]|uniref:hypothetical protein n=1 Tax=Novosphingobium sp. TaxID=1874826 RepID=UPI0022C298E6|nr:hypothetical protein [Novosphingobium sp.]MCZ8018696.1 hypothetical protein [Novosphingobium sp.]MCZ8034701.1 hypothetical protein [Novosphingobium sp.]MCZ8052836.1 hypothetical protein [Novosphingobium sp.]MCZ8060594.1 hypothetical protein [Novosphingobium sp.]MCZ8230620.1 hypothetical protein [Novosphingobium sp.]
MAFSDSAGKFWQVDLTSRLGAHTATHQGALACFIFAGLAVLGFFVLGGSAGFGTPEGIAVMIGAGLEFVVAMIAGLRLRTGKGAYWGMATAVLATLELIGKIVAISIGGIVMGGLVLVYLVNGIRGALALKRGQGFADDDLDVFG